MSLREDAQNRAAILDESVVVQIKSNRLVSARKLFYQVRSYLLDQ